MSKFNLSNKTVLVTGGGSGLGAHFAKVLSEAGARVIVCGRRPDKLMEICEELTKSGVEVIPFPLDVTDATQVDTVFENLRSEFGENLIVDVLINNAGYMVEPQLLDVRESQWDEVFDTNLKAVWMLSARFVQQLIEKKTEGSLINIASILGVSAQKGTGPYAASKAGLLHLSKVMALEWAKYGVRVNTILPGYYNTDITDDFLKTEHGKMMLKRIPQRRLGNLEDLTGAILLLASDLSKYMTGSELTIDGGHSIPQIV